MSEHVGQFFVGGAWVTPQSEQRLAVVEASTGQQLGHVPEADALDVSRAVAAARAAARPWADTLPATRAEYMEKLASAVEARGAQINRTISRENGMPQSLSAIANATSMAKTLRYYAGLARSGSADETREAFGYDGTVVIQRKPLGVVAIIVPWNYPYGLTAMKLAPALAAGCTSVIKPSPETSLDTLYLMEAVAEAGIPPGVVNLVTGGRETGDLLVRNPHVEKVSFTGSTAAGRVIGALCGEMLKPVTLELGGKLAAVILDDANLNAVMQGLGFLSFINSGQSCFLNSRVLAPRAMYDEVVDGLATTAKSFVLGHPLDPATTMGPVVSEAQRGRVESYIARGQAEGARLVIGGGRPENLKEGWFIEPTVFADVDNSMSIAQEEIFGPVVCVIPYDTEQDVIRLANDTQFGLAGTVWGTDTVRAMAVAREIDTGSIGINMWSIDPSSPFGGWKSSGLGKEFGPEGLDAYFNVKSINVPA